jgi:hypothetical protein
LNQAEEVFINGNGNNRKALKSEIFFWRGLCLKNLNHDELAGIELAVALKLDPENQMATEAMDEIRLISEMTAGYPQSVKDIIHKKSISRADWAVFLMVGLSKNFILNIPAELKEENKNLPDVSSNRSDNVLIMKAIQWHLVNVYPDGEFKPDLDLSWAEVIISINNILKSALKSHQYTQLDKPPFSDLPDLHPLYNNAAIAESLGIFKNLSREPLRLSESVKGIDALYVIKNLNGILK